MGITNLILLIAGTIILLLGIASFFNPNIARFINAPGGPRLKAIIAITIGIIIVLIGTIIQLSG